MKKRIPILSADISESMLVLKTNQLLNGLTPGGQILVDSDNFSFIYLMEEQDDYTYIILHEQIWAHLKSALHMNLPVWIADGDKRLELLHFKEELQFLVSNIKGNSNYGSKMVEKVEGIF